MRKFKLMTMVIIITNLFGCFGGFPEVEVIGIIEGYVKDIMTDRPVSNVTVQVQDVMYITDSSGRFPLVRKESASPFIVPNENGDSYSMRTDENYYNKTGDSIFSYGQKNLLGYITPKPTTTNYVIDGKIVDNTGEAIEGATVVVNGSFGARVYDEITDINGSFLIEQVPGSRINIYVYKNGYTTSSDIRELGTDNVENLQYIIKKDSSKKYGKISGHINGFNEFCSYSFIAWGQEGSNSYQFTISDINGNYTLYGIPEGDTQITVKSPGFYEPSSGKDNQITVTADKTTIHNVEMQYIKGE